MSKKLSLLYTSLLLSAYAFSQQDTLHGNPLDPVIVTANKTEQKQSTTGKVITVITKDEIEKSAGKTVAQVLNEQAGITINGALNDPGSVQTVYMRGAASGRALILVDGIPVSDPSMINNEFDLNFFSLNDIERIEVCRGAQSTLYGSDAIAGVINIITLNNNITKPLHVKATLAGGNLGTFKGNFQLYGKADQFTYSLRYAKLVTNGFPSAYDSTGKQQFANDGYNGDALSALVKYQADPHLSFKAFAQYSNYHAAIDPGAFTNAPNDSVHNKLFNTGTGFSYKNNIFTLTGNYQYSYTRRNYTDNLSAQAAANYSLNNYNSIAQFAELFSNVKLGKGFDLLGGIDYRYGSFNSYYNSMSAYGPYTSIFNDTSVHQSSLYASLHYADPSGKLNIEAGGRATQNSRYGNNETFTLNPSYALNKTVRVFGSISSGYKAPSLYELSLNESLKPEQSVNYEAGFQWQQKICQSRLVLFSRNINNGIDYNYNTYTYFNYIRQHVQGAELELKLKVTSKLNLTANYTFLATRVNTESRVTYNDTTYSYSLRVPKHNINATLSYQISPALYAGIHGKYVSKRYDAGGYDVNYNPLPDVALNAYFLLGAYAEFHLNKNVKFFADAQNITHTTFFDVYGYNSIPFLISAGVTIGL